MSSTQTSSLYRWVRPVIGAAIALSCMKVWLAPDTSNAVVAQIPDSGLQRKQLIDEQRRTNELLMDIKRTLEERTINVRVQSADNPSSAIKTPSTGR